MLSHAGEQHNQPTHKQLNPIPVLWQHFTHFLPYGGKESGVQHQTPTHTNYTPKPAHFLHRLSQQQLHAAH
jgi:hypothetical protein